jgi:hypothetical protein
MRDGIISVCLGSLLVILVGCSSAPNVDTGGEDRSQAFGRYLLIRKRIARDVSNVKVRVRGVGNAVDDRPKAAFFPYLVRASTPFTTVM